MKNSKIPLFVLQALACISMIIVLSLPINQGSAYAKNTLTTEQSFQRAFDTMLKNPANTEATLHYAELAVALKDYESAIPPLERLLIMNPALTEVRLEVGVLYYLLNSHAIAREYLEEVVKDQTASQAVVQRANEYLARM